MSNNIKKLRDTLFKNIIDASQVFIVGHNTPDYDAIGSALGVATLSKELDTRTYIIVNDLAQDLDPGVAKVIEDSKNDFQFISLEEYRALADKNSLLVTVDVNKKYLTSVQDDLDRVGNIIIIDHHGEDVCSISTPYKFIDESASSTSEMVAGVLHAKKIRYTKNMANYLLAGIILDTKRFQKNTSPTTFDITEKLCRNGADYDAVNKLFISNFLEDKQIYTLIFGEKTIIEENNPTEITIANTHIQAYPQLFGEPTVAFVVNRVSPHTIYRRDMLAKTADKMLVKYADVAFVLGYTNESDTTICARSKCDIDVGEILKKLDYMNGTEFPINEQSPTINCSGGGNKHNAGGCVTTNDIFSVERFLMDSVLQMAIPDKTPEEEKGESVVIGEPVVLIKKRQEVNRKKS